MRSFLILLAVVVLATSTYGQKVTIQSDKSVDFSKFKTYSWSKDIRARNPLVAQQIQDAVEQEFASRGFTKVEGEGDLRVVFAAAIDFDLQVAYGNYGNAAGNPLQTGIPSFGQAWDVTKGMLVVDVFDTSSNNSLWRAVAKDTLSSGPSGDMLKDAKKVEKTVKKAVTKMFKQFPRKGK
ncbi:MAG: DUF4136 domain-containing protein [Pyrinomonadaceae bacterium]|nr:DUF4136 domain-containing protein [Pyrinomonadaceae bacterium]